MDTFAKIELLTVTDGEHFPLAFQDEVLDISDAEILSEDPLEMEFTIAVLRRGV